jgi:hypothetical protein
MGPAKVNNEETAIQKPVETVSISSVSQKGSQNDSVAKLSSEGLSQISTTGSSLSTSSSMQSQPSSQPQTILKKLGISRRHTTFSTSTTKSDADTFFPTNIVIEDVNTGESTTWKSQDGDFINDSGESLDSMPSQPRRPVAPVKPKVEFQRRMSLPAGALGAYRSRHGVGPGGVLPASKPSGNQMTYVNRSPLKKVFSPSQSSSTSNSIHSESNSIYSGSSGGSNREKMEEEVKSEIDDDISRSSLDGSFFQDQQSSIECSKAHLSFVPSVLSVGYVTSQNSIDHSKPHLSHLPSTSSAGYVTSQNSNLSYLPSTSSVGHVTSQNSIEGSKPHLSYGASTSSGGYITSLSSSIGMFMCSLYVFCHSSYMQFYIVQAIQTEAFHQQCRGDHPVWDELSH